MEKPEEGRRGELSDQEQIIKASAVGFWSNVALTVFKFAAGFFGHSAAMVSDAVHSSSDAIGSVLVILGAKISGKDADRNHPYGHDRFECIVSIVLANILFCVAALILYGGIREILHPEQIATPTILPVIAAVVSIMTKELLYRYTVAIGKKTNSVSLTAEAWHHRSDALSSVGSLVGVAGARLGVPMLDPIAGIVIAGFIVKVAFDIVKETVDRLVDKACPQDVVDAMRREIADVPGVLHIDTLRTRQFGAKYYVDVEITMNGLLTLHEAHRTAKAVHDRLEKNFPRVKHCMVHVNPDDETHHEDVV